MKNERMEKLNNANVDTSKFFNVNVNVPVGADLQILIDGVPYKVTSDMIANGIMDAGYVFNRKTDGRYITAQTFHMLKDRSYNWERREYETGWDAYLRNYYVYDYQFTMLADELHRLARMEKEKDPAFEVHKKFFTKCLREVGLSFSTEMNVVCEEFEVVYKKYGRMNSDLN